MLFEGINNTMLFSIISFVYVIFFSIIFFRKKKVHSLEMSIFTWLVIVNLCALTVECSIVACIIYNSFLLNFILKLFNVCLFTYVYLIFLYSYILSKNKTTLEKNMKYYIYKTTYFIIVALFFILPVKLNNVPYFQYSYGPSVNLLFVCIGVLVTMIIFFLFSNMQNIKKRKATPIFLFIMFIGAMTFIQFLHPHILLANSFFSIVTFAMYNTIENPDIKMVNELNLAKDQADKANRAKTEFLSSMSHEIRTPLNAIVGFSECLMENKEADDTTKEYAKDIIDASQNLLEIVNGILDISKIEANKMEVIEKPYNLKFVLETLGKLIIPRIGEKPIEFKTYISPDIPGLLMGDVGKVKQIVLNILTNAAKYTDKGEIVLHVSCVNDLNKKESAIVISVKDTGRGIKNANIENLFRKFERIDEDKNTTIEGTGLGLAITKSLTEMMGGKIAVYSKLGEGSIFRVYLKQKIISMEPPKEEVKNTVEITEKYIGKKVLIVDDSKINLKVANHLMKDYEFEIFNAESGVEAIEQAKNNEFDLIFMDIMMPKKNGVETLNELKELENFNTPVIALTADAIEGTDEKYLSAGFNAYLSKPIDREQLKKVINKYLGGKK